MTGPVLALTAAEAWTYARDQLAANWFGIVAPLLGVLIGAWIANRQARRAWRKREFLDRINFSLNTLADGTLLIRTLYESNLLEVFLNPSAAQVVLAAARRTTPDDPILTVEDETDRWALLNSVLNVVSEQFADGAIWRDAGLPIEARRYLACLTCEPDPEVRTRKVRAMLVGKATLDRFAADYAEAVPKLENAKHHITRVRTLRTMAQRYADDPSAFIEIEVCVPKM